MCATLGSIQGTRSFISGTPSPTMRIIEHTHAQQLKAELSLDNPEHPRNSNFPHLVRDNIVQCAHLPRNTQTDLQVTGTQVCVFV